MRYRSAIALLKFLSSPFSSWKVTAEFVFIFYLKGLGVDFWKLMYMEVY